MSFLKTTKITTPSTPAASTGLWYYDNTLSPARPTFMDENGTKYPLTDSTVKLTGDLSATSSTSLTDTTGLVFAVVSGTYYRIQFGVVFQSANTGAGLKVGVTTPTFTIFSGAVHSPTAADGTAGAFDGQLTSSGDAVVATGVEATGTNYISLIDMMILPSANGNVQVQHARGGASASNITIKQGSFGVLKILN